MCSLDVAPRSPAEHSGETVRDIFEGMLASPASPLTEGSSSEETVSTEGGGAAATGLQPTRCEAPPKKVAKRGRKSDSFEDELLGQLKEKMNRK